MGNIKPKVSYIMPVYNSEKYISQAVYSVLNQTYQNIELILIDDCPSDLTMNKINKIRDDRILLLHNTENKGIAYSRNRGIKNASGEYMVFMDHDDVSLSQRTEMQVEFMEAHPEIDFVGGRYVIIDENDCITLEQKKAYINPLYIKAVFLFRNMYSNGEVMVRKSTVLKNEIWYEDNQYGMEDFKFWIRCSKVGLFSSIDEIVYQRRIHSESETNKNDRLYSKEKEKLYVEFMKYSMQHSDINLPNEVVNCLSVYSRDKICETTEELHSYYEGLKEVVRQVRQNQSDFQEEVDIVCRQYLMKQVRRSESLWKL